MNADDLSPPPERSLAEIAQSIRSRIDAKVFEPELMEDLRFVSLVRLAQGYSREEVSGEIVQWGWSEREAKGLVEFCLALRSRREKTRREESLLQKARRMAEAEGLQHNPDLAFDAVDSKPTTFRNVNYAKLILFLLLGFLALVLIVAYAT